MSTRIATPEPKKPIGDDRIDKPPSQQQPSQKNIPNETENVPNENLSELKSTNPSSNDSIPTLPEDNHHSRKRKLPTANPSDTQSEIVSRNISDFISVGIPFEKILIYTRQLV